MHVLCAKYNVFYILIIINSSVTFLGRVTVFCKYNDTSVNLRKVVLLEFELCAREQI